MRHAPIPSELFVRNRDRLRALLPQKSLVVVNANDILPTNADGTLIMVPNSDLFHLTGIEQEETILLLAPDAFDERHREILFVREVMRPLPAVVPRDSAAAVAYVDESLRAVAYRMAKTNLTRIAVVDRDKPDQVVGDVSLRDLLHGRRRTLEAEQRRERVLALPFGLARRGAGVSS